MTKTKPFAELAAQAKADPMRRARIEEYSRVMDAALQDPATWDDERDEILPGSEAPGVIVPVAFNGDDFARVAEAARRQGMTTAAFIQAVVLGSLDPPSESVASAAGGTELRLAARSAGRSG